MQALVQGWLQLLELQVFQCFMKCLVFDLVWLQRICKRLPQGARRPVSEARHVVDASPFGSRYGTRAPGPKTRKGPEQQGLAGTWLTHHQHPRPRLYQHMGLLELGSTCGRRNLQFVNHVFVALTFFVRNAALDTMQ